MNLVKKKIDNHSIEYDELYTYIIQSDDKKQLYIPIKFL